MKKVLVCVSLLFVLSSCGSLRNKKGDVYYNTWLGISIESALYGDGIIPGMKK
ncbi:MAG: hypothetical protein LBC92_00190 [Rickettsiales bacterium]|jgi:hypothetical protein|nr:hypothetical protein [Rickettsiales bacterium]